MLILDDDAMSRDLLTVLLQGRGYRVEAAASGDAGLRSLELRAGPMPAAVLTDLQMPGTVGETLARRLRAVCGQETLVLAMSGRAPAGDELEQFDGFLLKPFSVDQLISAMATERREPGDKVWVGGADAVAKDFGVLNEQVYGKLVDLMPKKQLHELYALCLEDSRTRIARMRDLARSGEEPEYLREAHALKGGCGMLGATELYEVALELERAGLRQGGTGLLVEQFGVACDRLERILVARG